MNRKIFHTAPIIWALVAIASIPAVCVAQVKQGSAIITQLAWSGDDALSTRLRLALQRALESSRGFDVSPRASNEKLRLLIPSNLYAAEAQGRLNFHYVVIFTNQDSKYLGVSIGSCWGEEKEVAECAHTVLKEADDAWKHRSDPQVWPR